MQNFVEYLIMIKTSDAINFSGNIKAEMKEYVPENENLKMSKGLR